MIAESAPSPYTHGMNSNSRRAAPAALINPAARASYAGALPVLEALARAGHEAWLVGGGVRDLLLARPVNDWDVATSAVPEDVLALWPDAVPTGIRHGTVTLPRPGGALEITTYRKEGPYSDGRHPDWVGFGATLEEDLSRRDFTVNAMALDPREGVLADPEGGEDDLRARRLRTVGDPDERFQEDGLRPLRGIRLAAVLGFSVDPETQAAMSRAKQRVAGVACERIRDELMKLLAAPRPSVGLELLRSTGLLEVVLPEIAEGVGVEQNRWHAYDVYTHTLEAVDAAPQDRPLVRLAALLHDVAKPRTRRVVDGQGTFYNHQYVGADMTRGVMDRLRFSRADRDAVARMVREHMFHYQSEWTDAAVRRFIRRVGADHVEDLFALHEADHAAHGTGEDSPVPLDELRSRIREVLARDEALSIRDLAVNGEDLMAALHLEPGPEVGRILEHLLEQVLEDPALNRREELLRLARNRRAT